MPEIAEVESVANFLNTKYKNRKLLKIETFAKAHPKGLPRMMDWLPFCKIAHRWVIGVERAGKHIIIKLSNGLNLATHLMMSGSFIVDGHTDKTKHMYAKVIFEQAPSLLFFDPRRFSRMFVCSDEELQGLKCGIDPLRQEISPEVLLQLFAKSSSDVKVFLLEAQDKITGIGNIYACEILHHAKINPFTKCNKIDLNGAENISKAIKLIIGRAVENRGSTLADGGYVLPDGSCGFAQNFHTVYNKKICACGQPISRTVQKNRSTFYCTKCQK